MSDDLLLETGDSLLLESGGSDSLLLESGAGGGGERLAEFRIVMPREEACDEGDASRRRIFHTGLQPLFMRHRQHEEGDDPDPLDEGSTIRQPLPPSGLQRAIYRHRQHKEGDDLLPHDEGSILRRPVPPTGLVPADLWVVRRIAAVGDPDEWIDEGATRRQPLPPTGLASARSASRRTVYGEQAEPAAGETLRFPRQPFHTGLAPDPPTPVDALKPFRNIAGDVESLIDEGTTRRQPLPPTGLDRHSRGIFRRSEFDQDPPVPDEGETLRFPRQPIPTGLAGFRLLRLRANQLPDEVSEGEVYRSRPYRFADGQAFVPSMFRRRGFLEEEPADEIAAIFTGRRHLFWHTGESAAVGRVSLGPPFLGGMRITSARWVGSHGLRVEFATSYGSAYHYQLYAGRTRIGVTTTRSQRAIVAHLQPSRWPQILQLVAVTDANRSTDYGNLLPRRAYNRVRVSAVLSDPSARTVELASGTEPGGSVDPSNVLRVEMYSGSHVYSMLSPPLAGSGTWHFELAGRDGTLGDGNRGTAIAASAAVVAMPPDVQLDFAGRRMAVAIDAQMAAVTFTEPD